MRIDHFHRALGYVLPFLGLNCPVPVREIVLVVDRVLHLRQRNRPLHPIGHLLAVKYAPFVGANETSIHTACGVIEISDVLPNKGSLILQILLTLLRNGFLDCVILRNFYACIITDELFEAAIALHFLLLLLAHAIEPLTDLEPPAVASYSHGLFLILTILLLHIDLQLVHHRTMQGERTAIFSQGCVDSPVEHVDLAAAGEPSRVFLVLVHRCAVFIETEVMGAEHL